MRIAFLWHMHQPLYLDPLSGEALLPWVRLHATRAYWDMIRLAREYPGVPMTFNLVPSLILQLEQLRAGGADLYRNLASIPADALTETHRIFLIEKFFQANWATLVQPHPGYARLLELRGGAYVDPSAHQRFSDQDLRDLQVWFNLAWFGFSALEAFPELRSLRAQGTGFREADKARIFAIQDEIIVRVLDDYRDAVQDGLIELCTSPFYHPILPLLCDSRIAARANPDSVLPARAFRHPEDAQAQITRSLDFCEARFGVRPTGIWPPEGSVSPEILPLLAGAGVRWIASSEGILHHSRLDPDGPAALQDSHARPSVLEPYDAEGIAIFFRELELSDRIGFTCSHLEGSEAARRMIERMHELAEQHASARAPVLSIILDGENPWEHYPDSGERFLRALFGGIERAKGLSACTFSQYLAGYSPGTRIAQLWSGSWIQSDFRIWMGHPEDAAAWDMLVRARDVLDAFAAESEAGVASTARICAIEQAREHLFAAEGSDWFWWFGDEFESSEAETFDRLFRTHLAALYQALSQEVPLELSLPIKGMRRFHPLPSPRGVIRPRVDGTLSRAWEWDEAGSLALHATGGAMARGQLLLSALHYGFDERNVYLRVDLGPELFAHVARSAVLRLVVVGPVQAVFELPLHQVASLDLSPSPAADMPEQLQAELERAARGTRPILADPVQQRPPLAEHRIREHLSERQLEGALVRMEPARSGTPSSAVEPGPSAAPLRHLVQVSSREMLEVAIPRDMLNLNGGGHLDFFLSLPVEGSAVLRFPTGEIFRLELPPFDRIEALWRARD